MLLLSYISYFSDHVLVYCVCLLFHHLLSLWWSLSFHIRQAETANLIKRAEFAEEIKSWEGAVTKSALREHAIQQAVLHEQARIAGEQQLEKRLQQEEQFWLERRNRRAW